jgi:glutathione-regulated potassium-efflux system ancillary protein KefG
MPRVLIIYAHPAPHKSEVNRRLAAAVANLDGVTFHDLYETYPDFLIDVPREQVLLVQHDVVVLQHPFYWYSTPAIMKEWQDLVLEYGFAYGENGDKLDAKTWVNAVTAGGPEHSYSAEGYNGFAVRELLAPLEQTARLCRMKFAEPFVVYGTLESHRQGELDATAVRYRDFVTALRDGKAGAAP